MSNNSRITIHSGDCLVVLDTLAENSIDSCVTDPPYHLTSIVKRFGNEGSAPAQFGKDGAYARASAGFMGKVWDGGDVAFRPETWAKVYRVLKPGAHLLAFGGTRTYHRMACAIEDAGFEIRDCVLYLYGTGFPKSHDVSKGIDRAAGAEREVIGSGNRHGGGRDIKGGSFHSAAETNSDEYGSGIITAPATDSARQWQGWGTALKPACEPIVLARKPLSEKTVAANVLRWGTGALNIDGCRVATDWENDPTKRGWQGRKLSHDDSTVSFVDHNKELSRPNSNGRWPANVVLDGSDEVVGAFPNCKSAGQYRDETLKKDIGKNSVFGVGDRRPTNFAGEDGSAARFFYCAKANKKERAGSKHPTVKPIKLIRYLIRMVTPPGGTVLDPFAGSGTTGEAAINEGVSAVLIEREEEYITDIRRRIKDLETKDETIIQGALPF